MHVRGRAVATAGIISSRAAGRGQLVILAAA
eukprot:SAG22_NODE_17183_length_310_cov_0.729858_1_plen_30_part_10